MNFWAFAWNHVKFINELNIIPEFKDWECAEFTAELVADIERAMETGDISRLEPYIEAVYEVWNNTDDGTENNAEAMEILTDWHWIVREAYIG